MTDYLKIEGTGNKPSTADRNVRKATKDLTGKLEAGKVSTDLNVVKTVYVGEYFAKDEKTIPSDFTIRQTAPKEWSDVAYEAEKCSGNLMGYDSRFRVEKYVDLTDEQKGAIKQTRGGPGAALDYRAGSSADVANRLF